MRERLITALLLVPLVLSALYFLEAKILVWMLGILIAYAAWEWGNFFAAESSALRLGFVVLVTGLMVSLYLLGGTGLRFPGMLEATAFGWLLMLVWVARFPTPIPVVVSLIVGALILVTAWSALSLLALAGWQWLLFLLLLVWAADVGAYFAGRRFGERKLAPKVSPGKTWAGVVGGMLLSLLVAAAGAWWFEQPAGSFLLLCFVCAAISVVGDLAVSMFKRQRGIKDSGALLPGHGGLLDRIDSLLAASPVFVLGLVYLGVVQ